MKQSISHDKPTIGHTSKKIAISLALLATVATSYSFAAAPVTGSATTKPAATTTAGDPLDKQIELSFQNDFRNAKLVSSEAGKHYTKITFKMNDMILFAFYSDNGQLLAVTRNILTSQLPIELIMNLKSNYSHYWITELFELNGDTQNCYYVSLEDGDSKLALRSTGNDWEVYQKTAKK